MSKAVTTGFDIVLLRYSAVKQSKATWPVTELRWMYVVVVCWDFEVPVQLFIAKPVASVSRQGSRDSGCNAAIT